MDAINTSELIRRMPWSEAHAAELEMLLAREWLVTNGLGGYAAGTVSGILTRRYHGLLVAALPTPFGRMMLLPHLSEQLRLSDGTIVRPVLPSASVTSTATVGLPRESSTSLLSMWTMRRSIKEPPYWVNT